MSNYGFVKVAAASPMVKVADCKYNAEQIYKTIQNAEQKNVSVVVFPELSLTAYTCGDLFNQQLLIEKAEQSLSWLCEMSKNLSVISIVGLPMNIGNQLYNVAVVFSKGKIHGIVPKTYIPNYGEFYEKRWFSEAVDLKVEKVRVSGYADWIPISDKLIFDVGRGACKFAVELCEDLWTAISPSSFHALYEADVIFNLSASNEIIGKHSYRKALIAQQSARCMSAYVYASVSSGESTTDIVYSGCTVIAENGTLLAEGERYTFENQLLVADIDVELIRQERQRNKSFSASVYQLLDEFKYSYISVDGGKKEGTIQDLQLERKVAQKPFVSESSVKLAEDCEEAFTIQTIGLARRLLHIGTKNTVIGISGGLDSTLALLVLVNTYDKLGIDRKNIWGITMPGFGTSDRTYGNAQKLMNALGISVKEIPIRDAVIQHFKDIDHDINVHDVTYENSQARERTQILMDYANKINGFVVGTGDLSELALGWCTYNGDHMSMYAVNAGVPKTLVQAITTWYADTVADDGLKRVLHDVVDTPVSPELMPATEQGEIGQITEDVVGPYILHDFFLYYLLRFGFTPSKIFFLAKYAFGEKFTEKEILSWMKVFYKRFFTQQFKRSCLPDGPKVGSVSLSPRGDWKMPSDTSYRLWMEEIEGLEK